MDRRRHSRDRGHGGLSAEDAALFDATMRDVKALDRRPRAPDRAAADEKPETPARRSPARPPAAPRAKLPVLSPGASADVDSRTLERLRRGRLRPEARLDLHGMTQDAAHRALAGFVARAQGQGLRCILIVTGKGRVSEGGGVLRNQVPRWLNGASIRPRILAFAPAHPRDGGAGALYVLLRRARASAVKG